MGRVFSSVPPHSRDRLSWLPLAENDQLGAEGRTAEVAGKQVAQLGFALALVGLLAQHDVDGAGHRLRRELGRGDAQHLDALDHVGRQGVEGEAGRGPFAVHEDLGIAAAQAAHPDLGAAPGARGDRHARDALEDVGHGGIAIADDLVALDDDAGRGVVAAGIVARSLHLDLLDGPVRAGLLGKGLGTEPGDEDYQVTRGQQCHSLVSGSCCSISVNNYIPFSRRM